MFDRSQILTSAWKSYRLARPAIFAAGDETGNRRFLRDLFAKMLRRAWVDAKAAAARSSADAIACALVAAQRRVMAEKVAAMSPGQRSVRISQLRDELTTLDHAPLGVRTMNRRRDLNAKLAVFTA
jgi:hypothetical protein